MKAPSVEASKQFVDAFDHLTAVVSKRLDVEWHFHKRPDLQKLAEELLDHAVEFGRLLRVVFRHGLTAALADEAAWYAAVFRSRGSGQDAFSLLLDSWIFAIQGTIRPPECNELAEPLQSLRAGMPQILEKARARYGTLPTAEIRVFVERLTEGDYDSAQAIVRSALTAGRRPDELVTELFLPAMREVGRQWENNELAIFQEHLATETLRRLLVGLPASVEPVEPLGRMALVSCVPHDEHQLIPLALGIYLELKGWRVRSLGGGLPPREIAAAVAAFFADALVLSCPMLSRLDEALDSIASVHARTPQCIIVVGGRGAEAARAVLEQAGATVVADFRQAHRVLEEATRA